MKLLAAVLSTSINCPISLSQVKNGTTEEMFAKEALFSRHPSMQSWPKGMQFSFAYFVMAYLLVSDNGLFQSTVPELDWKARM